MKKRLLVFIVVGCFCTLLNISCSQAQTKGLKLVFMRHAERPDDGDNLNCQGLNRSMLLPPVLYKKFGLPTNVYVPALKQGDATKRTRMLQTISPFVIKYGVNVNSAFDEQDYSAVGNALLKENGTVFIVWDHKNIAPILKSIGVKMNHQKWPDNDFDSLWIVTFHKGEPLLQIDKEGLNPPAGCPF